MFTHGLVRPDLPRLRLLSLHAARSSCLLQLSIEVPAVPPLSPCSRSKHRLKDPAQSGVPPRNVVEQERAAFVKLWKKGFKGPVLKRVHRHSADSKGRGGPISLNSTPAPLLSSDLPSLARHGIVVPTALSPSIHTCHPFTRSAFRPTRLSCGFNDLCLALYLSLFCTSCRVTHRLTRTKANTRIVLDSHDNQSPFQR